MLVENKLTGKVAVVTGSSAGIGAGIAIEMARQGALVTLNGRDEVKLNQVAAKCEQVSPGKKKAHACIVVGDISKENVRKRLITQTVSLFGKLDILVNNAGFIKVTPVEDTTLEALDAMLDIHVKAPFHLTKFAMPQLIKNKGNVINISTALSHRPHSINVFVEYTMAKAALDQFTMWTARELGPKGVRVNSIHPGLIDTDLFGGLGLSEKETIEVKQMYSNLHAVRRLGTPEDIAKAAVFLASSDASFVTGHLMRVDGGFEVMPAGPTHDA
uniref:Glucose 1-dehydrogenase n=1 Tax=Strigamia maritima TaxID=126957 RepID=T1ISM9_STRMM